MEIYAVWAVAPSCWTHSKSSLEDETHCAEMFAARLCTYLHSQLL
jgi:hypothetical protein